VYPLRRPAAILDLSRFDKSRPHAAENLLTRAGKTIESSPMERCTMRPWSRIFAVFTPDTHLSLSRCGCPFLTRPRSRPWVGFLTDPPSEAQGSARAGRNLPQCLTVAAHVERW